MNKKFWYKEWKYAEDNEDYCYAEMCKEKYRELVLLSIIKSHHFYIEKLKQFPMINLN